VGRDAIGKTGQSIAGRSIAISPGDFETLARALLE
jgi:hypothetical protein